MQFALWRLFVEIAELGSLSKAAQVLGCSQPVISKKINELEASCGAKLFYRTGRGVELTETGNLLLPKIRRWLNECEALQNEIQSLTGQPVGNIRLGVLPSTIHALVLPLLNIIQTQYPFIRLKIHEGQGAQLERGLEEGQLDLALLLRHQEKYLAGDIHLFKVPIFLISHQHDPLLKQGEVAFAALDQLPLVVFCRPNSWRTELDHLAAQHGISLNIVCEADSLDIQAQIAAAGQAYALLGAAALTAIKGCYTIRSAKIIQPRIYHDLVIGMSKHGKFNQAEKIVIEHIKQIAATMNMDQHFLNA